MDAFLPFKGTVYPKMKIHIFHPDPIDFHFKDSFEIT